MPWRIYCVFLAVCCLGGYTHATIDEPEGIERFWTKYQKLHGHRKNSDITFDKEPVEPAAGSGGWMLHNSDDEDLIESGSGSGSGMGELAPEGSLNKTTLMTTAATTMTTTTTAPTTPTRTTTSRPLTPCERQRQASRQLSGKYVPRCLPNGEFSSLQCRNDPLVGDCWCSDLEGAEIPGTALDAPRVPNCDTGENLNPCIHQLVLHVRSKLLGSFRPRCTADGQFDRVQCHGSMCFCVDERAGSRMSGTEVHIPDTPNCDDDSVDVAVPESTTSTTAVPDPKENEGDINIDDTVDEPKITLPDGADTIDLDSEIGSSNARNKEVENTKTKFTEDNKSNQDAVETFRHELESHQEDKVERASEIMTQPGILAGIIGGSVVLLLCVVLLVMFVVYRMRKKDEGSYPLDEPRKTPNYNYVRAPEKEFYA